jgi:hypothetical protein
MWGGLGYHRSIMAHLDNNVCFEGIVCIAEGEADRHSEQWRNGVSDLSIYLRGRTDEQIRVREGCKFEHKAMKGLIRGD